MSDLWSDEMTASGAPAFWLYCVAEAGTEETGPCKVGIATNPVKRLSALQGGNWRKLVFVWRVRVSERMRARQTEEHCLNGLRPNSYDTLSTKQRLQSEWVSCSPATALEMALRYLNVESEDVRRVA